MSYLWFTNTRKLLCFRRWIDRNRGELRKRFPKIESFFTRHGAFDYSTSTFAVGTAHEFILVSVVSFCSVWTGQYQLWFAALTGYSVHLLMHIVQWIVYRKYVPVYHYKPPNIALLHLFFCWILKSNSSILLANGFMGSYWYCSYHTKRVFCILLMDRFQRWEEGNK